MPQLPVINTIDKLLMGLALNEGAIDKAIANEGTIGSAGPLLIVGHGGVESSIVRPTEGFGETVAEL